MDFIEELYYGNINPNLKHYEKNSEYATAMGKFCYCEDKLSNLLEGKEAKLFIELINANGEVMAISDVENFKAGFKPGVQMICDSLIFNKNTILKDI